MPKTVSIEVQDFDWECEVHDQEKETVPKGIITAALSQIDQKNYAADLHARGIEELEDRNFKNQP